MNTDFANKDTSIYGLALTGGADPKKRRALDFYPSPPDVTHALMLFLKDRNLLPEHVWECACGSYAMSSVIEEYTKCTATDIIYGDDFLKVDLNKNADAIITNPPFNLSQDFILRAVPAYNLVALVLKSQYWHAVKRAKIFFQYRPRYVLPMLWRPDFKGGEDGGRPTMEVNWTVWVKGQSDYTEYYPIEKPSRASKPKASKKSKANALF